MDDPFLFPWPVAQDGYKIERAPRYQGLLGYEPIGEDLFIAPIGGLPRYYNPLAEDGLWRQFAATCTTDAGVLRFANKYGVLTAGNSFEQPGKTHLDEFLKLSFQLREIAGRLEKRDRQGAAERFYIGRDLSTPVMHVFPFPSEKQRGSFELRFVPKSLRDALLYQAVDAIAGNRQYRRCRNEECPTWFRLGPHKTKEGNKTFSARREFCSDRCRVAAARRAKKGALANA